MFRCSSYNVGCCEFSDTSQSSLIMWTVKYWKFVMCMYMWVYIGLWHTSCRFFHSPIRGVRVEYRRRVPVVWGAWAGGVSREHPNSWDNGKGTGGPTSVRLDGEWALGFRPGEGPLHCMIRSDTCLSRGMYRMHDCLSQDGSPQFLSHFSVADAACSLTSRLSCV